MFWTTIDSSWLHKADTAAYARELDAVRAIEPSMVLSSPLPAASGAMLDVLLDALGDVPGAQPFTAPDQAALEQMLAQMMSAPPAT